MTDAKPRRARRVDGSYDGLRRTGSMDGGIMQNRRRDPQALFGAT
jgi:hypothetical protein